MDIRFGSSTSSQLFEYISNVPELGLNILEYLSVRDLACMALVNRSWNNLVTEDTLWYKFIPKKCTEFEKKNSKSYLKRLYNIEKGFFKKEVFVKNISKITQIHSTKDKIVLLLSNNSSYIRNINSHIGMLVPHSSFKAPTECIIKENYQCIWGNRNVSFLNIESSDIGTSLTLPNSIKSVCVFDKFIFILTPYTAVRDLIYIWEWKSFTEKVCNIKEFHSDETSYKTEKFLKNFPIIPFSLEDETYHKRISIPFLATKKSIQADEKYVYAASRVGNEIYVINYIKNTIKNKLFFSNEPDNVISDLELKGEDLYFIHNGALHAYNKKVSTNYENIKNKNLLDADDELIEREADLSRKLEELKLRRYEGEEGKEENRLRAIDNLDQILKSLHTLRMSTNQYRTFLSKEKMKASLSKIKYQNFVHSDSNDKLPKEIISYHVTDTHIFALNSVNSIFVYKINQEVPLYTIPFEHSGKSISFLSGKLMLAENFGHDNGQVVCYDFNEKSNKPESDNGQVVYDDFNEKSNKPEKGSCNIS